MAGGVLRLGKWKVDILNCVAFRDKVRYVQRTVVAYLSTYLTNYRTNLTEQSPS
jgi:hypothetical protein